MRGASMLRYRNAWRYCDRKPSPYGHRPRRIRIDYRRERPARDSRAIASASRSAGIRVRTRRATSRRRSIRQCSHVLGPCDSGPPLPDARHGRAVAGSRCVMHQCASETCGRVSLNSSARTAAWYARAAGCESDVSLAIRASSCPLFRFKRSKLGVIAELRSNRLPGRYARVGNRLGLVSFAVQRS